MVKTAVKPRLYACNTKTDFTSHQTYIFAAGWAFMLFGFVFMFGGFANKTLYIFYCLVGVLLFSLYLAPAPPFPRSWLLTAARRASLSSHDLPSATSSCVSSGSLLAAAWC